MSIFYQHIYTRNCYFYIKNLFFEWPLCQRLFLSTISVRLCLFPFWERLNLGVVVFTCLSPFVTVFVQPQRSLPPRCLNGGTSKIERSLLKPRSLSKNRGKLQFNMDIWHKIDYLTVNDNMSELAKLWGEVTLRADTRNESDFSSFSGPMMRLTGFSLDYQKYQSVRAFDFRGSAVVEIYRGAQFLSCSHSNFSQILFLLSNTPLNFCGHFFFYWI